MTDYALTHTPAEPFARRFARRFIEGNYFYLISTLLMLYGCHRLVYSMLLTGSEFRRTVISLVALQSFELLIIGTALWIVRRFKFLGDACTLLIIEFALLLDPTFFSNSIWAAISASITKADDPRFFAHPFLRTLGGASTVVNLTCFVLVPLKLAALQRGLRLRIPRQCYAAFLFATAVVYFGEGPLTFPRPPFSLFGYYYLLWGATFVFALLMPALRTFDERIVSPPRDTSAAATNSLFITSRQLRWLPIFLLWLPVAVIVAHNWESGRVHEIPFFPMYLAPPLLALAIILAKNSGRGTPNIQRLLLVDFLAILAAVFSLRINNRPDSFDLMRVASHPSTFLTSRFPIALAIVQVIITYAVFYYVTRARTVLFRLRLIATAIVLYGIIVALGWMGVSDMFRRIFTSAGRWTSLQVDAHPNVILVAVWIALFALAARFQNYTSWFAAGIYAIFLFFRFVPDQEEAFVGELVQCIFALGIMTSLRFAGSKERNQRYFAAILMMVASGWTFLALQNGASLAALAVDMLFFLFIAKTARDKGFYVLASLQGLALFIAGWITSSMHLNPAITGIAGGIVFFAIAVAVTIHKSRMLQWFTTRSAPAHALGINEDNKSI